MAKLSGYVCDRLAVPIRRSAQAADGIFISLMSARAFVAVVLAWGTESAARIIHAGRGGRLQGGIGFVYANCSILPARVCTPGISSGRAQGQGKVAWGGPAVET